MVSLYVPDGKCVPIVNTHKGNIETIDRSCRLFLIEVSNLVFKTPSLFRPEELSDFNLFSQFVRRVIWISPFVGFVFVCVPNLECA